MITTRLTDVERSVVRLWTDAVLQNIKATGVVDRTECPNPLDWTYRGLAGELAVARLLNVYPDFRDGMNPNRGLDLVYRGHIIDVKFSSGADMMIANVPAAKYSDLYILCTGHPAADINVVGYILTEHAHQNRFWFTACPRPCWRITQADLLPIENMLGFRDGRPPEQTPGRAHQLRH